MLVLKIRENRDEIRIIHESGDEIVVTIVRVNNRSKSVRVGLDGRKDKFAIQWANRDLETNS